MKNCYKCGEDKPLDEFHKNKNKKDGLQNYCKACAKVRNRNYYLATPERNPQRQASNKMKREAARDYVREWLMSHPCVDCGETDIVVLEFDHVRGEKKYNIAMMIQRGLGLATIQNEIAKCDTRCANCHRRVTASRGGWWRTLDPM